MKASNGKRPSPEPTEIDEPYVVPYLLLVTSLLEPEGVPLPYSPATS